MKAAYTKPRFHVEYFALSQTIAASCGAIHDSSLGAPNWKSKDECGWVVGGEVYWSSLPGCDDGTEEVYPEGWDDLNIVCYNNPNGGNSVFSS